MKGSNPSLKGFSQVSNARGTVDWLLHWGGILLVFWAAHRWDHWLGYTLAVIVISGFQHGLVNMAHDAWHFLCFKSARLNDFFGAWFYSYPVGIPFFHDRQRHFQHHRRIGFEDDPDRVNYANDGRVPLSNFFRFLLVKIVGGQFFQVLMALAGGRGVRIATKQKPDGLSLFAEYAGMALCQALLFGGCILLGRWWEYWLLWFLPLVTLAPLWAGIRAFVEHSHHQDDAAADERLYDFHPSPVEAFFISPCDFNYHALHHSYPAVPHYRLKTLKQTLGRDGADYTHKDQRGYFTYLVQYFSEHPPSK